MHSELSEHLPPFLGMPKLFRVIVQMSQYEQATPVIGPDLKSVNVEHSTGSQIIADGRPTPIDPHKV